MKQQMKEMRDKEIKMESEFSTLSQHHTAHTEYVWLYSECAGEQEDKLNTAKREIEVKWQKSLEMEKEKVSEKLLDSLDKDSRAEMVDNGWLKREVRTC